MLKGNAVFLQELHQVVGHAVVDDALADDGALLFAVEGSRVVLIIHDVKLRILGGENFFGFSFVKLFPFFHVHRLLCIHIFLML